VTSSPSKRACLTDGRDMTYPSSAAFSMLRM
jgi:hypothetical protein